MIGAALVRGTFRAGARGLGSLIAGLGVVIAACTPAFAQRGAELVPSIGWQWGGTRTYSAGDVHINGAINYGAAIAVPIRPGEWGEIDYTYQASEVVGRPDRGATFKLFDLGTHYIQLAGLRDLSRQPSRATPYFIGGLGTTILAPGSSTLGSYGTQWLFSLTAGGGVKVTVNERTSLRLQARLLLPLSWSGNGLYFGSGGGGLTVSGGAAMPQGDVSLGAVMRLGT